LAPADARDDAVRADGVAAHRHLHPCLHRTVAMGRELGREAAFLARAEGVPSDTGAAGAEPVAEMADRPGAEGDVDERVELEDLFALRFGVATADRYHRLGPATLERRRVAEVRGGPVFRL